MATAMSTSVASPGKYNQNNCDCVSLVNQQHCALQNIESSKFVINLLQKESAEDCCREDRTPHLKTLGRINTPDIPINVWRGHALSHHRRCNTC
jgi:hypothetical protein